MMQREEPKRVGNRRFAIWMNFALVQGSILPGIVNAESPPNVLFVDATAPRLVHDGSSWQNAYVRLGDALGAALFSGGLITEIRAAQGLYTPASVGAPRTATFYPVDGVEVKGGYAGFATPDPNQRDASAYPTILSGDLNHDDETLGQADNCYHVVTTSGNGPTAVLDGLIITAGNADGPAPVHDRGGGVYNVGGTATLVNCIFRENKAGKRGGGVYSGTGQLTLRDCRLLENSSPEGGGAYVSSGARLDRCLFHANDDNGLDIHFGSPILNGCTFVGNLGDGINVFRGGPRLVNCVVAANGSEGLKLFESSAIVTNSTFALNSGAAIFSALSLPRLNNCIVWDDAFVGEGPLISYSCIQGGAPGIGNINLNPVFVDPDGADGVSGTPDDDFDIRSGSPCIDSGSNVLVPVDVVADIREGHRFIDDPTIVDTGFGQTPLVDMGAFEYQADCNGNGVLDSADIYSGGFADCNGDGVPDSCDQFGDVDSDGDVDLDDYVGFVNCETGPTGGPLAPPCDTVDADCDHDIDLLDFRVFQLICEQGN